MDRNKVIKGLECCSDESCICPDGCPYSAQVEDICGRCFQLLAKDALTLLKELSAFKDYLGSLYGQGLEIVNWHLNGATEPFDNFYESAIEESGEDDDQRTGD